MAKNLMIVESPAKAKTIEKFLGSDFQVVSCYGHIRDLPKDDKGIDIQNNFTPIYEVSEDKIQVVDTLKKMAAQSQEVWLATDEDREGEAISWHLCDVLGLNPHSAKRIVFHEITKPAIAKAVAKPRIINQNLVDAQQARRILDRLVGFEVSPILWRKVSHSAKSAGRVQSVAVRIIVEREREIQQHRSQPYFRIVANFNITDEYGKTVLLKAELNRKLERTAEAQQWLETCKRARYSISDIQVKPAKKSPPAPFTTSTLQQEASRKLGFTVARTMRVAQKLYEAGKITYMRTDSPVLSETAIKAVSAQIEQQFGERYLQTRQFKAQSDGAQEAHEAIRPTYFEQPEAGDSPDEKRLYGLIWKRAVASQMADAQLERTQVTIDISTQPDYLQAKGEVVKFDGFLRLYRESAIDEESEETQEAMLPPLQIGQLLSLREIQATERFTRPAPRYNEASLVRKLEELGIGRPSTYAPTISTIQNRGYVVREDREGVAQTFTIFTLKGEDIEQPQRVTTTKGSEVVGTEKGKLFPTDVGAVVNDFLVTNFEEVFDYNFTANIEKEFDEIAHGHKAWRQVIGTFYGSFHPMVENTLETSSRATGERQLGIDPKSGKPVIARLGRYGAMVQVGNTDDSEKPAFASIRKPMTIETITLEQALDMFKLPRSIGDYEGSEVKVSEGRFGPYVLHQSKFYSLNKSQDPMTLDLEQSIALIEAKRQAEAQRIILDFTPEHNIQVLNGRYGPYIKAGDKNVKIPKGKEPTKLTLEECLELADATPEPKTKKATVTKSAKATSTKSSAAKTTTKGKNTTATKKTKPKSEK